MFTKFYFDKDRCTGCGSCVVSCMDEYNINTRNAYRRLYQKEYQEEGKLHLDYYAIACQHCEDPPCLRVCPKGCFHIDEKTDFVLLNSAECIGCKRCAECCQFDAISYDLCNKATKCNGCIEKVRLGQQPKCVSDCFVQAISLKKMTEEEHAMQMNQIQKAIVSNDRIGI